ncbi:MAG: hypothetical protein WC631_02775 [Candidatus Paceibacterota bacterium]|jgi:hypothetical protein
MISSKTCEKINCNTPEITKGSLSILSDFIKPELLCMTLTEKLVTEAKKLKIISPRKRYAGYFSIGFCKTDARINISIIKKESGSSKYQNIPKKLPSFLTLKRAFASDRLRPRMLFIFWYKDLILFDVIKVFLVIIVFQY